MQQGSNKGMAKYPLSSGLGAQPSPPKQSSDSLTSKSNERLPQYLRPSTILRATRLRASRESACVKNYQAIYARTSRRPVELHDVL